MKLDNKPYEEKMGKTLAQLQYELSTIRAGRANPAVLDKVTVDYYGAPTKISQLATVTVTDARTIAISPWDGSMLKKIEKAIQTSDIGINPSNDGKVLRLVFPQVTEETRKQLTKQISKMGEEAKVAVRNIRRDANDKSKAMKKNSEMTEDEQKQSDKSIQELTDRFIKDIDAATAKRSAEIMEV
ncbi:MAG: ribosome recycling factor [Clostridia bacterium]|nr:ribosome recycling factor [Clostridia bacterium]